VIRRVYVPMPDNLEPEGLARFFGSAIGQAWVFVGQDTGVDDDSRPLFLAKRLSDAPGEDPWGSAQDEFEKLLAQADLSPEAVGRFFFPQDDEDEHFIDIPTDLAVEHLIGTTGAAQEAGKLLGSALIGLNPSGGPIATVPADSAGADHSQDGNTAERDGSGEGENGKDHTKTGDAKDDSKTESKTGEGATETKTRDGKDGTQQSPAKTSMSDETLSEPGIADLQTRLWRSLTPHAHREVSKKYFEHSLARFDIQTTTGAWRVAPEPALLVQLDAVAYKQNDVADLKIALIRARNAIPTDLDNKLLEKRLEVVDEQLKVSEQLRDDMKSWRKLASKAPWFLLGCLIVATLFVAAAVALTAKGKINGAELALSVFVAALFAISPSVLLLLERPLAGLDSFSPGVGGESKAGTGDDKTATDDKSKKSDPKGGAPSAAK
jgi:hypothetical protein